MKDNPADFEFDPAQFVPSLAAAVQGAGLDGRRLNAACLAPKMSSPGATRPREELVLEDGKNHATWQAPPLRMLFRGDQLPPPDIHKYPPVYVPLFYFVEKHVLTLCRAYGDKTDGEFEEWYSNLRRRPDGRSLGPCHDQLWRVLALLLAMRPTSQAEYEGVVGALAGSASCWRQGHASRNYVTYLQQTFP
jgi:hypothetical protein